MRDEMTAIELKTTGWVALNYSDSHDTRPFSHDQCDPSWTMIYTFLAVLQRVSLKTDSHDQTVSYCCLR
jgi:hypothetical protein